MPVRRRPKVRLPFFGELSAMALLRTERSQTIPGSRSRDLCHCIDSSSRGISRGGASSFNGSIGA